MKKAREQKFQWQCISLHFFVYFRAFRRVRRSLKSEDWW